MATARAGRRRKAAGAGTHPLSWMRRVDLVALGCGTVALVVYLLHGFDGFMRRDSGIYSYGGQQFVEGLLPYVPILNRAGPLAHVVPAGGVVAARVGGFDDVLGIRVEFMLLSVACVVLTYLLGRDTFGSRSAGVAAAAALISFEGFLSYATNGPREKTAMVMFLLAAMLAMVHRRWATTGVFIALATLTWQPVFFPAIVAAVLAVLLTARRARLRALCWMAVGGLVPSAITVAVYALTGNLKILVDCFFMINLRYTHQSGFFANVSRSWWTMQLGFGVSLWFLLAGMASLLALAVVLVARSASRCDALTGRVVPQAVLLMVGIVWTARAYDSWPDSFVLLPSAAVGVGALAYVLPRVVGAKAALAVTVAGAACLTGVALAFSVSVGNDRLLKQQASVQAVRETLPSDATYVSIDAPQPLVLGRERALNRFQTFGHGMGEYMNATYPGGMRGYGRWIGRQQPTVIVMRSLHASGWLQPVLESDYERVGRAPQWIWFVRESVPEQTRRDLKAELKALSTASAP